MSIKDWPAFRDMNWLRLHEGPGDLKVLPIAPTMRYITYAGERYFRMPQSRASWIPGERGKRGRTEYGGSYLWDGWWEQKLAEIQAAKDGAQAMSGLAGGAGRALGQFRTGDAQVPADEVAQQRRAVLEAGDGTEPCPQVRLDPERGVRPVGVWLGHTADLTWRISSQSTKSLAPARLAR